MYRPERHNAIFPHLASRLPGLLFLCLPQVLTAPLGYSCMFTHVNEPLFVGMGTLGRLDI